MPPCIYDCRSDLTCGTDRELQFDADMTRILWESPPARLHERNWKGCLALGLSIVCSTAWGVPHEPTALATADAPMVSSIEAVTETELPPESELVYLPVRSPNPIAPQGWRRTDRGWEHVSTWPKPGRPLGEIVREQEQREPRWLSNVLTEVRQLPPLTFAALQIVAIAGVVRLSFRSRR